MTFEYELVVRGYELDSYNHVNHAVYLNYLEQARWEIFRRYDLFDYFKNNGIFVVVTDINIHFSREARIFDELVIKTSIEYADIFINFKHKVYNSKTKNIICKAKVKNIIIDKDKVPVGIPEKLLKKIRK